MDKLAIAIRNTAHNFKSKDPNVPDGPQGLAQLVGMREGTFYNQVNPNNEGHSPNIYTVEAMLLHTKDPQILDVLEEQQGRVAFKLPDVSKVGDAALLEMYADLDKERGDVGRKMAEMMRDGKITREELPGIKLEMYDEIRALLAMYARMETMAE